MKSIQIRGARTHNLKNIHVDLPRDQLIVITGLSGSGKSSLAFDTLYAEGQRRYVESLSAYARQFLQLMEKPDVDAIEGLSPAISIEQKATSHNPRSTVGTVTEIHDYLRLLFARVATPYCPEHDQPLVAKTVSEMVDTLMSWPVDTKLMLLSPLIQERKGEHIDLKDKMVAHGFVRFRVDGVMVEADDFPKLKKNEKHSVDVVVDRLKITKEIKQRLAESLETALNLSEGRVIVFNLDTEQELLFSSRFACPICDYALQELEPRLFSFNNPVGACPTCDGLGVSTFFDSSRVVTSPDLSLAAGAIKGWDRRNPFLWSMMVSLGQHYQFDVENTPFSELSDEVKQVVLYGSGKEKIAFSYESDRIQFTRRAHVFEGVIPNYERRYRETDSMAVREDLAKLQTTQPCPECGGARLKKAARYVRLGQGKQQQTIFGLSRLPLQQALSYFELLELTGAKKEIAQKIVQEIRNRLMFLNDVGLGYLSLERSAETLSGGEAQRIRLASQIGSGLTGVMYVLDEPSIGLHQRDNDRLIQTLKHLRDLGNTIIVVEHDEDMIRQADFVVDMGLGAGVHGGEIIFSGSPHLLLKQKNSLTGQYLTGDLSIGVPNERIKPSGKKLQIKGASGNNLKQVDVDIPVGLLTCVTGVSGSGKSTLVNDTLYCAAAKHIYGSVQEPAPYQQLKGLDFFDKVINVDQSPIGRTPRSNPATYTGLLTPIRELFSQTQTARERGYEPGRFSFNVKGGRCEACQGDGVIKVEMHFLPDVYVPCDVCQGKRYNRETLEVLYKGKNIHDVLEMTVEDAAEFFAQIPLIYRKLQTLLSVGLGYIKLGQSATTLSGGEAQRVKLSLELSKRDTGKTLYILDEPTTGLHFHDIAMLLKVLHQLRDAGNTLVVIEHNLDVIKTADWIIDMGPEGGSGGGRVLIEGTPEEVANNAESFTGHYLKPLLEITRTSPKHQEKRTKRKSP